LIFIGLWLAIPIASAIALGTVQDRWMLQDTPYRFAAMAVATVVWFTLGAVPVGLLRVQLSGRILGGLVLWAALGSSYLGPLALTLLNGVGDKGPAQAVEFQIVSHLKQLVRLQVTGAGPEAVTFTCTQRKWQSLLAGRPNSNPPGLVRRGRLGLLWGEFVERSAAPPP
jgi:hypothetical protein